jgi:RND family efflux transporter MFP subunit
MDQESPAGAAPASSFEHLRIDRGGIAGRPRNRRKRWLIIAAVVLVLGAVAVTRLNGETQVEMATVTTAYPYQGVTLLNATGYVVAQRKASVSTKATGRLEWLGVQEGSVVKAGQVIARLESSDVKASEEQAAAGVQSAKAELQDARVGLERARDLAQKKFISVSALDAAQARYDKAMAGVAVAQAARRGAGVSVDQTLIRAPFDGVVLTKAANVGDILTPFSSATDSKGAVVTMADMETLEVEADVSESNLSKITVGQPCEIALDAFPDLRLRGEVSRLVPTVDRSKASVLTKIRFVDRDPRVLPEMSIKVAFLSSAVPAEERKPLTVVHKDAIVNGRAFVVTEGRTHETTVKTGKAIGDMVEVDGLKTGDKVVLKPSEKIHDGSRVVAVQK